MLCFRLLNVDEPAAPLVDVVASLAQGRSMDNVYAVNPSSFSQVPNAPFAYWVSDRIRRLFTELDPFEGNGRAAKLGASTKNDFRFLRLVWEIPPIARGDGLWVLHAKGGAYSPFYADVHLAIKWANNAEEIEAELLQKFPYLGDSAEFVLHRNHPHFQPGLTWPARTTSGMSVRVLPAGAVFANKGPAAFIDGNSADALMSLLSLLQSAPFQALVSLQLAAADAAARSYEVGVIQRTVVPTTTDPRLAILARSAWAAKREPDTANLTSHAFVVPALARSGSDLTIGVSRWSALVAHSAATLSNVQREIDDIAYGLYGIDGEDRRGIEQLLCKPNAADQTNKVTDEDDRDEAVPSADSRGLVSELLDYGLGIALGRWDIRYATGEQPTPEVPHPFAPLPVCPPGMLQGDEGLPLSPEAGRRLLAEGRYPLDVAWDGILVDDPEHPLDLERRIHDALAVPWGDRANAIVDEACQLLDVKPKATENISALRVYFRESNRFFKDHLARYSKSRRQAPIYWPLSTKSGSYTLWLYYHRLNEQTMHTALADFVGPKLRNVKWQIRDLKDNNGMRTKVEELQDFEAELTEMHAEIERIIRLPWRPNLNDGVLITASPLWSLFRLGKWQRDLKACWQQLEAGDFDWAHLAYTIWPDRVRQKCKKDRSLAIAHGLESICEVDAPKPKAKRGKKAKSQRAEETPDFR